MIRKIKVILLIILLMFSSISFIFAYEKPKKITFACANKPSEKLVNVYMEAFRRLGISFEYYVVPARRASQMSNSGEVDGEISRVCCYGKVYPDLVRVKEANKILFFKAYSFNSNIRLDGWNSLKGTEYNIDYRMGVKLVEKHILENAEKNQVTVIRKVSSAISRMDINRSDIYIDTDSMVESYLKTSEFKSLNKKLYEVGIMEKTTAHAFLNKKHKSLEPELSRVLKDLKKEGYF